MKKNKMMVVTSFCVGAMLFAVTSYADIVANTGYGQLKESIKLTAKKATGEHTNFSADINVSIKDGVKQIISTNNMLKVDNDKTISVEKYTRMNDAKSGSFTYNDENLRIRKNERNEEYYLTKYDVKNTRRKIENPLEHDRAKDFEKIVDALVGSFNGNLKDYIVLNENEDGSKVISTKITQGQMPSIVNAVSSLIFKEYYNSQTNFRNYNFEQGKANEIAKLEEDVFIKNIEGRGTVNSDGTLENLFVSAIVNAIDSKAVEHEFTFEFLVKFYNVGSTVVEKPDLKDAKVIETQQHNYQAKYVPEKFAGKYRTDLIIDKNNKYVKIGEKNIEITKIDDKYVYGKYYETYIDENVGLQNKVEDFKFKAKIQNFNNAIILNEDEIKNIDDLDDLELHKYSKGNIGFNTNRASMYFHLNKIKMKRENIELYEGQSIDNSEYQRVFGE